MRAGIQSLNHSITQSLIPTTPLVTGNNVLSELGNLLLKGYNGCPESGINIVNGNNTYSGCGNRIVDFTMAFPGPELSLQDLQRTRQILLTWLYPTTTSILPAKSGL